MFQRSFIIILFCIFSFNLSAGPYKSVEQRFGYAVGKQIGDNVMQRYPDMDKDAFLDAIKDLVAGKPSRMSEKEIMQAAQDYQNKLNENQQKRSRINEEKGQKFAAEFKKKKGVQTLEGGILYRVIKSGKGTSPRANSKVKVHYRGTHIDGREFDSSYKRNQPASFPLNGVIKGWQIAVQNMQPGDKWEVVIPSDLAYGESGRPGAIEPGETLVFEIELLEVLN